MRSPTVPFPSDLQIARNASLKPIEDVAAEVGIGAHLLEPHGRDVMKIRLEAAPGRLPQCALTHRTPIHFPTPCASSRASGVGSQ
jgi:formyltetrahydrofolate synthetase